MFRLRQVVLKWTSVLLLSESTSHSTLPQAFLHTFNMFSVISFWPSNGTLNQCCARSLSWDEGKEVGTKFITSSVAVLTSHSDSNLQSWAWEYFTGICLL